MSKAENHNGPLNKPKLKQNIFSVPEGYFDGLKDRIMDEAAYEESELAQSDHLKQPVFEVPEGYFSELQHKIEGSIKAEEGELAQNDHLKESVFTVPDGYFEKLESKLETLTQPEEPVVKIIPLYQRNWFKMAIAAVLVVGFFLIRSDWSETNADTIEDLSNETILEYLYEQADTDLELLASVDGFDLAIDEILEEQTASYDFDLGLNPELDYEFEYLEQ